MSSRYQVLFGVAMVTDEEGESYVKMNELVRIQFSCGPSIVYPWSDFHLPETKGKMSVVLSDIPEQEQKKLHFIFKLWLVTNDPSKPYLKWNLDRTVLIVNLESMMLNFITDISTIFACKTIDNFLWLLYKYAFEKCTKDVLKESELDEIDLQCSVFFRHPQFIGRNQQVFDAWLSNPAVRVHEYGAKGRCTLPSQLNFIIRENIPEFHEARMRVLFAMMHLESSLRQPLREQSNATVVIPEPHVDRPVMNVPPYLETKEIEGNYGPVSVSEVKHFLGNLITVPYDDLAKNEESENAANEPMEEVTVIVDDETSPFLNGSAQETAAVVENEAPITLQYNDLRELYESVNFWTTDVVDGSVIEYHEIYEIENVTPQEVGLESEATSTGMVENSNEEILPLQHTENDIKMEEGIMSAQCLTESMKACVPAIDFD